jgi:hypothetical protein
MTVKTTAGPVQLSRPKLRGTTEAFASRLFGSHVTRTNALETLVIASFGELAANCMRADYSRTRPRPGIPRRPAEGPGTPPWVSCCLSAIGVRFLGILFP